MYHCKNKNMHMSCADNTVLFHLLLLCRYAGRFDCGCVYYFTVKLLSTSKKTIMTFETEKRVDQWAGKQWEQV